MSKKVYELASGNHEMYIRRRRPDTLEVQQMKSQKKDEEATRDKDKAALAREVAARAKAEQLREEMAAKFKEMEERMASREGELEEAQGSIRRLEEQLGELREAKEQLEGKQEQLSAMIVQLEEAKNLEYEERTRMEEEIRTKQEEIADIRCAPALCRHVVSFLQGCGGLQGGGDQGAAGGGDRVQAEAGGEPRALPSLPAGDIRVPGGLDGGGAGRPAPGGRRRRPAAGRGGGRPATG
jgi:hypothetical protein